MTSDPWRMCSCPAGQAGFNHRRWCRSVTADDDRWQPWEIDLINAGRCAHQTGYGLPGMTYCENRTTAQGKPFCAEHEQETAA